MPDVESRMLDVACQQAIATFGNKARQRFGHGSAPLLAELRQLARLIVGKQCVNNFVDFTHHHPIELVERQVDAVVGQASLREVVSTDTLGAVARAHLTLRSAERSLSARWRSMS